MTTPDGSASGSQPPPVAPAVSPPTGLADTSAQAPAAPSAQAPAAPSAQAPAASPEKPADEKSAVTDVADRMSPGASRPPASAAILVAADLTPMHPSAGAGGPRAPEPPDPASQANATVRPSALRKVTFAAVRRAARKPRAVQMVVENRRDRGSLATDEEVRVMAIAANRLMQEVADAWGYTAPTVVYAGDLEGKAPEKGAYMFHVIGEDAGAPDALAYHTEEGDGVDGCVLTKAVLMNGGAVLYDPRAPLRTPTVAAALFHELAEAFVDPTVNAWWQDANGVFYSAEICDPVQGNNVVVDVNLPGKASQKVALSDFVYPAWRDIETPDDGSARINYAKTLKAPFTIDHGGFVVRFDPVTDRLPQQVFGRRVAPWMRSLKLGGGRYARRARHFDG